MSNMFKTPPAPKIEPAAPMPQESEIAKAARRKMQGEQKTEGARSTILSSGGRETLGA